MNPNTPSPFVAMCEAEELQPVCETPRPTILHDFATVLIGGIVVALVVMAALS